MWITYSSTRMWWLAQQSSFPWAIHLTHFDDEISNNRLIDTHPPTNNLLCVQGPFSNPMGNMTVLNV